MKKIIQGKTYNTKTAERLASYTNGRSYSDFSFLRESLYRTRRGQFFLAGSGGAMTKYATACPGGSYCEGDDIILLSKADARKWTEEFANKQYEEIFSVEEG